MSTPADGDVTGLLKKISGGEAGARDRLLTLVYDELRRIARNRMASVPPSETLQPTALVNEAYIRLFGKEATPTWENRRHFFWAAARAMHDILVEKARRHTTLKRGGDRLRIALDDDVAAIEAEASDLLCLSEALEALAGEAPRAAEVVQLRFFVGLTHEEAARVMDVSSATARREWAFAKAWLHKRVSDQGPSESAQTRSQISDHNKSA